MRKLKKLKEPERWKRYKDTDLYVSDQGRCKKIINGEEYEVGFYSKHESKRAYQVKVGNKNESIKKLVYETFKGEIPKGYCVVHKHMLKDDSIYNLEVVPREEHGHRTGAFANSQKVVNLDKRVIYRSCSEAARKLHCSRSMIGYICRGQRKNPIVNVAWWDEENEKAYRGKWKEYESSYCN